MAQDEWPLHPVSGWELGKIPAFNGIFIRFEFLSHTMQGIGEANPGRRYLLTLAQARDLKDAIDRALAKLDSAGPQRPPGERH